MREKGEDELNLWDMGGMGCDIWEKGVSERKRRRRIKSVGYGRNGVRHMEERGRLAQPDRGEPVHGRLLPLRVELAPRLLIGRYKELNLHLLEFPRSEDEVARSDLFWELKSWDVAKSGVRHMGEMGHSPNRPHSGTPCRSARSQRAPSPDQWTPHS